MPREVHRAFRILAQFNGFNRMREIPPEEAIVAWRFVGHPLRDYLVACAVTGVTIPGSETDQVQDAAQWLDQVLEAATTNYRPYIDAITLHEGAELQLTETAIDVLAERAALRNPVRRPADPAPAIERRVHVRDTRNRILFLRGLQLRNGSVALVDYNGRRLAPFTIDASQLEVRDGWYEPGRADGGGFRRRVPNDDDGGAGPVADLNPPQPGRR